MKKNQTRKMLVLSLVGAVLVSAAVSGVTVRASDGLTVLDKVLQLLQLAKEVDSLPSNTGEASVGAQAATSDDVTIAKFNSLALVTDPTNSANSNYQNFHLEYVGFVGQVGNATNTPLSVKNSWAQTVYAKDAWAKCIGSPSSTIYAFAGTSTVPSSPEIFTSTSSTLKNFSQLLSGDVMRTNESGSIVHSSMTSSTVGGFAQGAHNRIGIVPVKQAEYFNIFLRSDEGANLATSTATRGCTDIMVGVTIEGHSTSTVQY